MRSYVSVGALLLLFATSPFAVGQDSPISKKTPEPETASKDEPTAKQFSLDAAVKFMDQASIAWTQNRKCFACHTNYSYLYARPLVSSDVAEHKQIRQALEEMVNTTWKKVGPRWDAEVVSAAAALAFNDSITTGKLQPTTQAALDRIWTVQKDHGGFNWLKCGWPPMESDDHYGATLAALAVGFAPGDYTNSEAAKQGLEKIRKHLVANPGNTLHHETMVLWVATYHEGFMTAEQKKVVVDKLLALQKADGGWGAATLGPWKRGDGFDQDLTSSDGYGTGFVIYVLRRAGIPASDARLQKGIAWLKANQRESGRWYTRSLNKDNKHFLTNAGTAFAIMALDACNEAKVAAK